MSAHPENQCPDHNEAKAIREAQLLGRVLELEKKLEGVEAEAAAMREALELSDYKGERLSIVAGEDRPVRLLCEQYGYGAVMDSAARQWRNTLGSYGDGALLVGACVGTVARVLSGDAGKDLLERLQKLERVAEAARWFLGDVRLSSEEGIRFEAALAALDGGTNG